MMTGEYAGINVLPDLSEYRLNHIYGLGDKEHNNRIILEREAQRKRNLVGEIKLWEVWKHYQIVESLEGDSNFDKAQQERISFL